MKVKLSLRFFYCSSARWVKLLWIDVKYTTSWVDWKNLYFGGLMMILREGSTRGKSFLESSAPTSGSLSAIIFHSKTKYQEKRTEAKENDDDWLLFSPCSYELLLFSACFQNNFDWQIKKWFLLLLFLVCLSSSFLVLLFSLSGKFFK